MKEKSPKKVTIAVYIILRLLVVGVMIAQIYNRNYVNVFLCVLTLILFMIPIFVDKKLNIHLPDTLEIIVLLFIFSAEILGEIQEYYLIFKHWDTMLHTINGFLMAAIGFSLIDILNQSDRFHFNMSPAFVALVAFCFSMTIGVLWEFFEFSADMLLHTDMQKDALYHTVSSVWLNPDGVNVPFMLHDVQETVIRSIEDGVLTETVIPGGYLDIGIYDTMKDLFVNFIGAFIFSVLGFFYIKSRGKSSFIHRFIPKLKSKNSPTPKD